MLLTWSDISLGIGTLPPGGRIFRYSTNRAAERSSDRRCVGHSAPALARVGEHGGRRDSLKRSPLRHTAETRNRERVAGGPAAVAHGDSAIVAWSVSASIVPTVAQADSDTGWDLAADDSDSVIAWVWHRRLRLIVI